MPALRDAVVKLDPRQLVHNPVMFVNACVATLLTVGHDRLIRQEQAGGRLVVRRRHQRRARAGAG